MKIEIDRNLVQKIIDESIGSDYIIDNVLDSEKYIFIDYKHRVYDTDDDRGKLIGVGQVVYNKEKQEYKMLGSGDYIAGDYLKYLKGNNLIDLGEIKSLEQIITRIKQRKYVNFDDCFFFIGLIEEEYPEVNGSITFDKNLKISEHFIFENEDSTLQSKIIGFWEMCGFPYFVKNQREIVLFRTDKMPSKVNILKK